MAELENEELETLREAYNTALRLFRAEPSQSTKADVNEAQRLYQKRRMELDPEFVEARLEAARRWREKKKLGIPTGPSAKSKKDPLDEKWKP